LIGKSALIVLGLLCIVFLSVCRNSPSKTAETPFLNHGDSVQYTGIQSCQPCHADKYETFIQTGMGQSFDSASVRRSAADFANVKPVYDAYLDLYYLPLIRNGVFWLKEYRLSGKDTVFARTEKIDYIVGSGHHTNSHMTAENGYLFQAPITFYTQKGRWDLPPGFENGNNTRFNRKIGLECMSCHNATPKLSAGSENQYLSLPHGIDCERCHGPGQIHIREKQKGNVVDVGKETDYTIVNPRKLSWQRQIDICQRCHLQGNAVLKPGKSFTDFRPGMVLSETFDQFSPEYEDGEDFVMAAHAERFQKSKCFTANVKGDLNSEQARVGFTCISCHNPHVSVRQTNTLQFNKTCNACHAQAKDKQCSEKPALLKEKAYNCVACHMPASGTSDIPHVTVHDHYIRKPGLAVQAKPSKLKGLRCITNEKPDVQTETEAYLSYYEKFESNPLYLQKAGEKSKELDAGNQSHLQTLIHLHYINKDYKNIVSLAANSKADMDAWTFYRIAKAYEQQKDYTNAGLFYIKAIDLQDKNLDFLLQYAIMQIKAGDWKKAESTLIRYNALYSKTADAWAYLGLVYMNERNYGQAKLCFTKALALDPDQITALRNLKLIYSMSGDKQMEARTDAAIKRIPAAAKSSWQTSDP
jgi:Tetratricopeptide repeat